MATQQKWTQLFEQVVGRKPTAKEFIQGKQTGFDPKSIKAIAAVSDESESVAQSQAPEAPSGVSYTSPTYQAPKSDGQAARWTDAFRQVVGREPSAAELEAARANQFNLQDINAIAGGGLTSSAPASFVQAQPEAKQKKKKIRRKKQKAAAAPQPAAEKVEAASQEVAVQPAKAKKGISFMAVLALVIALISLGFNVYQTIVISQTRQALTQVETTQTDEKTVEVFGYYFSMNYLAGSEDSLKVYVDNSLQGKIEPQGNRYMGRAVLESISTATEGYHVTMMVDFENKSGDWERARLTFEVKADKDARYGYVVTSQPKQSDF